MHITIHQLEIFKTVVITGSLTLAARRLGVTQPLVSQQLAKLEEQLGARLVIRNRKGLIELTAAGNYWDKSSSDLLSRFENIIYDHDIKFRENDVVVQLGVIPNLRSSFITQATTMLEKISRTAKIEVTYEADTKALSELLKIRKLNFAITTRTSLNDEAHSLHISPAYTDVLTWVVPRSVTAADIKYALNPEAVLSEINPTLLKYITMPKSKILSKNWYDNNLKHSESYMEAPTFSTAIDLVADNLGTCLANLSLLPNISRAVIKKVRVYDVAAEKIETVVAMHRHLKTHSTYSLIHAALVDYCTRHHSLAMSSILLAKLP